MDTEIPILCDAAEVGTYLGVDASTVNRWARDGALPDGAVFEWGTGPRRVRRFDLQAMLAAARVDRTPARRPEPASPEQPSRRARSTVTTTVEDVFDDLDRLAKV